MRKTELTVDYHHHTIVVDVYERPNVQQLLTLAHAQHGLNNSLGLRIYIDPITHDLLAWRADKAPHSVVVPALGAELDGPAFTLRVHRGTPYLAPTRAHANIPMPTLATLSGRLTATKPGRQLLQAGAVLVDDTDDRFMTPAEAEAHRWINSDEPT